jgi:hypothetical protein
MNGVRGIKDDSIISNHHVKKSIEIKITDNSVPISRQFNIRP